MTKFVGKFRKNSEKNEEYNLYKNYIQEKKFNNKKQEIKTFRNRNIEDILDLYDEKDEKY